MAVAIFKTQYAEEREARNLAIYKEWCAMTSVKGQSKTRVTEYLMKKYGIHSPATLWSIRKRMAGNLKK